MFVLHIMKKHVLNLKLEFVSLDLGLDKIRLMILEVKKRFGLEMTTNSQTGSQ